MTQRRKAKKKPAPKAKPKGTPLVRDCDALLALKKQLTVAEARANKVLKPLKEKLEKLEDKILQKYSADDLVTVKTKQGSVTRTTAVVPSLKDWDAFWAYVLEKNAPELLQKRVGAEAWKEHLEQGQPVPGVESFTRVGLLVRLGK